MNTADVPPMLHVPARDIPVPTSVSPEAQAILAAGIGGAAQPESPALDDHEGWRQRIAAQDEMVLGMIAPPADGFKATVTDLDIDGVVVYEIIPDGVDPDDSRVYLEIHGGALIMGSGAVCRAMGLAAAARVRRRMWCVDYRMPPDHPYPTPLDDCLTVYRALLATHRPDEIIVGGSSAGGNLAAALVVRARDEGLPLPAAALLMTPELDLTESGDTFQTNLGIDTILTASLMPMNLLYAGGHDLAHPHLSPLLDDVSKGFCPTFLSAGTRDLFLSNAVRMHRKLRAAGVDAELHVQEAAPHGGFFGFAPEDHELSAEVRRFVDRHWGAR